MRLFMLIGTLFALGAQAAPTLWIVGENYVGYVRPGSAPVYFADVVADSHGFDADSCRLWINEKGSGALRSFTTAGPEALSGEKSGNILSEVGGGNFLTRNTEGTQVEKRNALDGKVAHSYPAAWVAYSEQILSTAEKTWSLGVEGKQLWVAELDTAFTEKKRVKISNGVELWGFRRIELERTTGDLWVGFTHTTPTKAYSPSVQRISAEGTIEAKHGWKERGLFFDSCLEENGDYLLARDLPSDSGYTVPVHSFLERVTTAGKTSTYYSANTNDFIDAVVCRTSHIYMIQRSIFGSDGSYLVAWDRKAGTFGDTLFKLPGKARDLFSCR